MMQISLTIRDIEKSRDKARTLASQGKADESDEYVLDAYSNAIYLIENYGASYFTDAEYEFLQTVINEIEA
jgi:hypothetical protein